MTSCLNIHHKTYLNGKEPWEYPLNNFEVLCDKCHAKEHGKVSQDKFCENPDCLSPKQPIRQCFRCCFACSQKLLEQLVKSERENDINIREAKKSRVSLEELKKLNNDQKKLLEEKIETIVALTQTLEDVPNSDGTDELLIGYNSELAKAEEDLEKFRVEIKTDEKMRIILVGLVLVVIGLLCFSIFTESASSKGVQASTLIVDRIAPPVVETFTLNKVDGFIGQFIEHESRVMDTHTTKGGTVFINLGGKFPKELLTLVIFKSARGAIGKLPQAGQIISYAGIVTLYEGKPRIVIESGGQLTITQ
ncbi:MAG: hypothetical protein P8R37_12480 [Opitutae bacterium]|nr:hypothetical protein [Opitutae bacterium]